MTRVIAGEVLVIAKSMYRPGARGWASLSRGQDWIGRCDPAAGARESLPARLVAPGAKVIDGVLHVFGGV